MTKISVYNIDEYVTADDKWIGTDVNTYNKTKNFTPRKLSHYFNNNQVINTGVDLLYKYFTITPPETRPTGTLSFETEIGQTVNFSAISTFLLSKTTLKGNDVVEFLNFLVGTNVLLYKAKNINLFGSYNIVSVEEYIPEPNFLVVNVDFKDGNGFIEEDEDYMISLIDISSGGGDSPITIVNDSSLFSTGLIGTGDGSNATNSNFFGYQAGKQATGANTSNFIGENAGNGATNAYNSNFIGQEAGYYATGSNGSNFIGGNAGSAATNSFRSNFIGGNAGSETIDAQYSNFFGFNVGVSFADNNVGSNNIIIGKSISLPDGAVNSINLGGVLFGTGTNDELTGTPLITPTSGGKIGIGVVEPTNTLHIYSEAEDTSGLRLERLTSASPTTAGQAIGVDASGNVVTVEGGGGGSQDLQSVTDEGATTTNGITITIGDGGGDGITSFSSQGYGIKGESNETYGVYGTSPSSTGVYGTSDNGYGVQGYSESGVAVYGDSLEQIGVKANSYSGTAMYVTSDIGTGLFVSSEDIGASIYSNGIGLQVNGNGAIAIDVILGNSNKGLVINSGTSSTGNFIELAKNSVNKLTVNQAGELTAQKLIKDGGFDYQFLKADGSVDNNTYLTSADLPSTLDLYATTFPDPVIAGYTALVRNIADSRYNTVAVDVPTPLVDGTLAAPTLCGVVISDPSVLLGNPGVFNFTVIGNIRRVSGSTSSGADFFYSIYKRDLAGTEVFISESAKVPVPANGGFYIEYISTALWNNGIFLSTDRIVLKFYGIQTGGGTGAYYEFLFGGTDPVRGTAAISSAIIPNIYLKDLADVEKTPALNNEILYWNDSASLWEHSLAENLVPLATATQKGLVSTTTQTFAGDKTFTGATSIVTNSLDLGIQVNSNDVGIEVNASGVGIEVYGILAPAGVFNLASTNTSNIVEFKKDYVVKASINNDGSITSGSIVASSINGYGINAISQNSDGVSAESNNGAGVSGVSINGIGGIFMTTNGANIAEFKTNFVEKAKIDSDGLITGTGLNASGQTINTIASFDANKNVVSLPTATYPSLTELAYVKGVTSGIQSQFSGKQDTLQSTVNIKSINGSSILGSGDLTISVSPQSAFTILANKTASSAVPTEQVYKDVAEQTYSLTPNWSGTAPTTILANTYKWNQVGSLVTVRVNLIYSTAGNITQAFIPLPTDMPTPLSPTGFTASLDILYYGTGMFNTSTSAVATTGRVCFLRRNSTNTGFEFVITHSAFIAARVVSLTLQYFT